MINTITTSDNCIKWLKRLDTQLYEPANQNSSKVLKVEWPMIKKTLYKNFDDYVINSLMYHSFPVAYTMFCLAGMKLLTLYFKRYFKPFFNHWGSTSIYHSLSYPLRSLYLWNNST